MPTLPARAASRPTGTVTVTAPAKINVGLAVGPLRPDGFHQLRTVFHAVDLCDLVSAGPARPGTGVTLALAGPEAGGLAADPSNLAWRAAVLLAERSGRAADVQLTVTKQIPVAAGLAGGSADAAAALLACARLWQLDAPAELLYELAGELGSDVGFALHGGSAIGTGRGELLEDLGSVAPLHWVLALAFGGLSTPAVYAELDRQRAAGSVSATEPDVHGLVKAMLAGDLARVAELAGNDLQPAALALAPQLDRTLATGRQLGALTGLVSGSGPTCAFLAADAPSAEALAVGLQASGSCRYARPVLGGVPGATVLDPAVAVR